MENVNNERRRNLLVLPTDSGRIVAKTETIPPPCGSLRRRYATSSLSGDLKFPVKLRKLGEARFGMTPKLFRRHRLPVRLGHVAVVLGYKARGIMGAE